MLDTLLWRFQRLHAMISPTSRWRRVFSRLGTSCSAWKWREGDSRFVIYELHTNVLVAEEHAHAGRSLVPMTFYVCANGEAAPVFVSFHSIVLSHGFAVAVLIVLDSLAFLADDLLIIITDTLALVRLRRIEGADFSRHFPDKLLVRPFDVSFYFPQP